MSRVFVGAAGVGDHVEVTLVGLCHYEVINDSSFLVGEEGQRTLKGEKKKEWEELRINSRIYCKDMNRSTSLLKQW